MYSGSNLHYICQHYSHTHYITVTYCHRYVVNVREHLCDQKYWSKVSDTAILADVVVSRLHLHSFRQLMLVLLASIYTPGLAPWGD